MVRGVSDDESVELGWVMVVCWMMIGLLGWVMRCRVMMG